MEMSHQYVFIVTAEVREKHANFFNFLQ